MKVRLVYKPDKSVVVIHYCPKSKLSEDEAFSKAIQQDGLSGLPYDDIDSSELPQTRVDRSSWEGEKGRGVTVNQVKAQQIKDAKARAQLIEDEKGVLAEKSLRDKGIISD